MNASLAGFISRWWVVGACLVWGVLVVAGMTFLWRYKSTPGASADGTPVTWPAASQIAHAPGRATVLLFAHPGCSCTRASIDELATLMTRVGAIADAHVLFMKAPAPGDTHPSATRKRAEELPGVEVLTDLDGSEAALFGAKTSGEAIVYDASGALVFHGGITAARGHSGDNAGRRRITELLTRGKADRSTSPTFGCGLAARETR